jgi:hypothetical protein
MWRFGLLFMRGNLLGFRRRRSWPREHSTFGEISGAPFSEQRYEGPMVASALLEKIVRLPSGSPYLAIHLLEERIAPLVALLVVSHQLELLHGKVL